MNRNKLKAFVNDAHKAIDGWFYPGDWQAFVSINEAQKSIGLTGDLAEVGVWCGKSLIFLSLLAAEQETVSGFDLFPNDTKSKTEENLLAYGLPDKVKLLEVDTADITFEWLRSCINQPLRLLHVDAGHEYFEVLAQLNLYTPFLETSGVLIMDDTEDREFPGVSEAIYKFCDQESRRNYVPFCVGANKKYYCADHMAAVYQKLLVQSQAYKDRCRLSRLAANNILILNSKLPVETELILNQIAEFEFPCMPAVNTQKDTVRKYSQNKFGSGA